MKNMTLAAMAAAVNGQLHIGDDKALNTEAEGVVVDSRLICSNGVFVATKGERVDGHSFIPQVMEKGALCAICEDAPENEDYNYIVVKDSFQALKDLAKYYRQQLDIKIVGIIGSVGKTSTKEIIASTLSSHYNVLKTQGNFNNEVGVPLTLFRIRDEHEVAVVEMGISDFGEMSRLGDIVWPDVVVMTNIGPCHLEQLIDLKGVLKAKTEVFNYMPEDGVIVLYAEDEMLSSIKDPGSRKILYYSDEKVHTENVINKGLKGSEYDIVMDGESIHVNLQLPGEHMILNSLAAAVVAKEMGLSNSEIAEGINNAEGISGRSHLIDTEDYTLIDDCYNANPKSMKSAIALLNKAITRKVAILGDMFELGENEKELHAQIGEYAVASGIDVIVCVGKLSANMYEKALEIKKQENSLSEIIYFENKEDLISTITEENRSFLKHDDTILIKASHGMGFAQIVQLLSNAQ